MNFLMVKLSSMGDIIMATPCLRAIRRHDPQGHVAMVVGREFLPLVAQNPHVNEILVRETDGKTRRLRTLVQAATTLHRRRGPRFDLALDLQGNFHSAAWTYCSGAKTKAGIGQRRFGWQIAVPPDLTRHSSEMCASVLRRCGIPVTDLVAELHLCPEADREVEQRLRERGLPPAGFLLISPFSLWPSKEWPPDRYASLIRRLAGDVSLPIVITGSSADGRRAGELLRLIEGSAAISLVGALRLEQALCLYRRARMVISGDSGPMHAAAALGTPVIALFGPTWPEVTGPLGPGHRVVQARRPPHHTTYREPGAEEYMAAIREDDVYDAVRQILLETASTIPESRS